MAVRSTAGGPLRRLRSNPRYFTDGSGHAVYLTGSHTWADFQDNGPSDPPRPFDYDGYLDSLVAWNHNFFRLYVWEQAKWTAEFRGEYWFNPLPWVRTGPGLALDGNPKFDLHRFNEAYFERLRARVEAAGRRGIYVSVMLFNGWSLGPKGEADLNDPWRGHPFNAANNISGIDGHGDPYPSGLASQTLLLPTVVAIQEAYLRKVIDAVNDLDNVLYEVSNEGDASSIDWQYHMINFVKAYEVTKPKQHPIGMTAPMFERDNAILFGSPADWVSPNTLDGYRDAPPPADGSKVIINDTDHLGTVATLQNNGWVWKAFTRGENPILMDPFDGYAIGVGAYPGYRPDDPRYVRFRRDMGETLTYASRMDLAHMAPRGELASTGFCLAHPAVHQAEYLVYLPEGGLVTVDLRATEDSLAVEWLDPARATVFAAPPLGGGSVVGLRAPFRGPAVLYLRGV
ncbi:MAG TPA: DUF6298 domain-containing protein [Gemmatimonadales bacterium]|nr:DUF6298 domain-containing protein [Gemmatimonadales bacterium]